MDKISQEGRDERTRLKICPQRYVTRGQKFVMKVVTNEQD